MMAAPTTEDDVENDKQALVKSLKEMVECYGENDGIDAPISIITRAVAAIRAVEPDYTFEDY